MEKRRKQERGKQRKQEIEIGKRKQEKETGNRKREGGRKKEERRCFTSQGSSGKEHRESQGGSKRSSLEKACIHVFKNFLLYNM